MTEEQLDLFFKIFLDSLNLVKQPYMTTVYGEMKNIADMLTYYEKRNLINDNTDLRRTGERIFCYELYHQIRKKIELDEAGLFKDVYLQGELKKHQIAPILQRFGLERLSKNFIPDFLLHSPSNADDHPYIIEVKTDTFLTDREIADDLEKICEFMISYRYQRGIFLSINIPFLDVIKLIDACPLIKNIPHIHETKNKIQIVVKENELKPVSIVSLNQIL